jgi:regulator of sigma E protease
LLFAIFLLSFIWGFGFEVNTLGNRIVLFSEISQEQTFPADIAGLQTGDRIININGRDINFYHEIQEVIALNANRPLDITIERDGRIQIINITPILDRATGAGRIGISFWADPVIGSIRAESPAERAGLLPGDIVINANGEVIRNSLDLIKIREQNPDELILEYRRNGLIGQAQFFAEDLTDSQFSGGELGFSWEFIQYRTPNLSIPAAVAKGFQESFRTLSISIQSLRLLFMGIDLTQAVSGPVRITYMIGDMATQGFGQGLATGLRSTAEFIALISIALCVMNLLPLPVIDGGMIILFLVEWIRRKPIPPKAVSIFQTCGMVIIFSLLVFAVFGDILFFVRQ